MIDPDKPRRREAGGAAEDASPSTPVVPDALAGLGPLAALRGVRRAGRRTCASSSAARRKLARAELPRHAASTRRKLQNKQAFLFRLVDVANELFAMAATVSRAQRAAPTSGAPEAADARRAGRPLLPQRAPPRRARSSDELWSNDDALRYRHGVSVLEGASLWLEAGILEHHAAPVRTREQKQKVPVAV